MQALAAGGRHEIRTVRVADRFGDYGLVGLVIAERGQERWNLDTFLLSCRVLGRGVEHRIVAELGRMARRCRRARRRCAMRVETTKRNTPARSFLESIRPGGYRTATSGVSSRWCRLPGWPRSASSATSTGEVDCRRGRRRQGRRDADRRRRSCDARETRSRRAAFELVDRRWRSRRPRRVVKAAGPRPRAGRLVGDIAGVVSRGVRCRVPRRRRVRTGDRSSRGARL